MLLKLLIALVLGLYGMVSGGMLTLSEAEHKAITCSYEMRAAYADEQAKEWEKLNAASSYMPSVAYSGSFNRMDRNALINYMGSQMPGMTGGMGTEGLSSGAFPSKMTTVNHSITLSQPISNGGGEIFALRIARETKKAIELQLKESELNAIYNTRKAYFDCIIAMEQQEAAKDDLSWTQQNLNKAKIRHQGGGVPLTDVLQWESDVARKENNLAVAYDSYRTSLLNLLHSFGMTAEKLDTSLELQSYEMFESWYAKGCAQMTISIDSNLQLQALKHYTKVADESKKIAISKYLPNLNAFVTANWPMAEDLVPEGNTGWMVGMSLDLTLFSGFRNGTNFRKVNYEYQKTVIDEQKIINQLKVNLERIKMFYKTAYDGVLAARIQRNLMDKQLQLMQERYDGGLVNQSELLEVALSLRMARVGYIQKLLECLLLESEYLRNIGKLEVAL